MLVFIDASAFIALMVSSEKWHKECVAKYQDYAKGDVLFYTSNLALVELYTRLIYDFGKQDCALALKVIRKLEEEGRLRVFQLDAGIFSKAEEVILRFAEHRLSFTDAVIYSLVKLYDLDEVFTLDADFKKVGLKVADLER